MTARRRKPAAPKEETVTTTEVDQTNDTAPEDVQEDAATTAKRAAVRPEDAVFLVDEFSFGAPPKQTSARTYVPTPYDTIMQQMWDRYVQAGSPAWSLSGKWTKEDKPAEGWWADRTDIWASTIVPDVVNAESLIRRAATHMDTSYRFRFITDDEKNPVEEPGGGYRIWFTVAPVLKQTSKAAPTEN